MKRLPPKTVSPDALHNVSKTWKDVFSRRHPTEADAALLEYFSAIYGKRIAAGEVPEDVARFMNSLPLTWAAFWRPLGDGASGRALARKLDKFRAPALSAALSAFDEARVLFGDVVHVEANHVTIRDAFEGSSAPRDHVLLFEGHELRRLRAERIFTVVVPLGDGRWYHPSVLISHASWSQLTAADWLRETEAWLAQHGREGLPARCEGEPQRWLVPVVGQAYGVLLRLAARDG